MKHLTLPLVAACLVLGAWAAWEHIQRVGLEGRLADLESVSTARDMRGQREQSKLAEQVKSLKKEVETQKAAVAAADSQTSPASSGKKKDTGADMAANLANMMSDPKMRDVMKSQARMGIDMLYRDLYDLLDLKEPQRSQLEKLITDKATIGMEAGFAMMDGTKTAEDRKLAGEDVKKKTAEVEKQIKDLLGKEDYDKVKRYENSTLERMQLKTFNSMLTSKELGMDEGTEAKLMDAMYQEREKFPFASSYVDQQNPDIGRFTAENSARFNEEYGQLNERIVSRAAGILNAQQLEVFRQSQEQQMNMIKMQMEMGARMFGGKGK